MNVILAVVGVADQYMILITVALLFTVLALAYSKNLVLKLLAGVSWIVCCLGNFVIGDQTSPLTAALSYLFLAFAIIFISYTVIGAAESMRENRSWR